VSKKSNEALLFKKKKNSKNTCAWEVIAGARESSFNRACVPEKQLLVEVWIRAMLSIHAVPSAKRGKY
jgi:hypothetical protein